MKLLIGVIGDFNPEFPPHPATSAALEHAAAALSVEIEVHWLPTPELLDIEPAALERHDALWCAPGSPYRSLDGALRAVRLARERGWPLLGTCGGFQHMVIEFARNVLEIEDAQHAEYDPYASRLVVSPLSCSLAGRTMSVRLVPGSRVSDLYGKLEATEQYYCNFGLNPDYQDALHDAGLRIVGSDQDGEARIVELPDHPMYVATLFVPQLSSQPGQAHPLAVALLQAASDRATQSARRA
ncbi:MAG TPA: hypothetical protein VGM91_04485 [Conexibacter sp.]